MQFDNTVLLSAIATLIFTIIVTVFRHVRRTFLFYVDTIHVFGSHATQPGDSIPFRVTFVVSVQADAQHLRESVNRAIETNPQTFSKTAFNNDGSLLYTVLTEEQARLFETELTSLFDIIGPTSPKFAELPKWQIYVNNNNMERVNALYRAQEQPSTTNAMGM